MKRWCIINLTRIEPAIGGELLEKKYGPTCFYTDENDAVEELFRLQKTHPTCDYFLFEAVGKITLSQINPLAMHLSRLQEV